MCGQEKKIIIFFFRKLHRRSSEEKEQKVTEMLFRGYLVTANKEVSNICVDLFLNSNHVDGCR